MDQNTQGLKKRWVSPTITAVENAASAQSLKDPAATEDGIFVVGPPS
jgi:hypothetical protein